MPSREEMYFLPDKTEHHIHHHQHHMMHHNASATTTQDFISRDIENLVSEIKENLRLSGFKSRHQRRTVRPSPYLNPSRSLSDCCCESCAARSSSSCPDEYNSASNNSIGRTNVLCSRRRAPAIKLLKQDTDDAYEMLQDLLRDGDLIKEAVRRLQKVSPKQRYCYDSDEESSRSPLHLYKKVEV